MKVFFEKVIRVAQRGLIFVSTLGGQKQARPLTSAGVSVNPTNQNGLGVDLNCAPGNHVTMLMNFRQNPDLQPGESSFGLNGEIEVKIDKIILSKALEGQDATFDGSLNADKEIILTGNFEINGADFIQLFNTHTHNTGVGPSGPPNTLIPPPPP